MIVMDYHTCSVLTGRSIEEYLDPSTSFNSQVSKDDHKPIVALPTGRAERRDAGHY